MDIVPEGMFVCHTCDNPSCVNPEHLWVGSNKDNMQDSVQKGRIARGERQASSKLTGEKVKGIKKLLYRGIALRKIAKDFGVSHTTIRDIERNHTWKHVEEG